MASVTPTIKEQARKLLDGLPEDVTWDGIVYELAVRRSIEFGLVDADAGRVTGVRDVRRLLPFRE